MAGQIAELMEANEALAGKLARLEHLLSRNSGNSSNPPSRDDDPGKPAPPEKQRGRGGPKRSRGKQPGAPGSHLAWTDDPDERRDRFPEGRCDCGDDLTGARDLGVVDRYQQHEIPQVAVTITQYDQHQVRCGCGRRHTAARPDGARAGPVGYGPNLAAFAVYLMVVHFIPAHRVVALLESLTGTAPSVGFVHGMLAPHRRAARPGSTADPHADHPGVCGVLRRDPAAGRRRAPRGRGRRRPSGTCWWPAPSSTPTTCSATGPWPRSRPSCVAELAGSVVVHDRYQNYDSAAARHAGPPAVHRAPAA